MAAVFGRALGSLLVGIFMMGYFGHSLWILNVPSASVPFYVGLLLAVVGALGLVYWRWRTKKLRAPKISN